jgi:bacterioferritin
MKGSSKIIELLNNALTKELTAINQYFIHSKMCENWGYRCWPRSTTKSRLGR